METLQKRKIEIIICQPIDMNDNPLGMYWNILIKENDRGVTGLHAKSKGLNEYIAKMLLEFL